MPLDSNETYVVYINWDGFAKYYYDYAKTKKLTPNIDNLTRNGVMFENAYTGIPSVTTPMQTSIVTGAWPDATGNMYRYYDKTKRIVIQMGRENKAETIAEAIYAQGLSVAAVQQFTLENRGTIPGDPYCPYITAVDPKTNYSDYAARFNAAIALINGEVVGEKPNLVQMYDVPRFLAIYIDDLDGIGHNFESTYGVKVALTEKGRLNNIMQRLNLMDKKLGEFISSCKNRGIYDNMVFILTTDHGMAPFGQQGRWKDNNYQTKLPEVIETLKKANYITEVLFADQKPKSDTDIVIVTVGLQLQLSFTHEYKKEDIEKIINLFKNKYYVGDIMKKDELKARGCCEEFADLLISPMPPYSFKTSLVYQRAKGQHDSLDEKAQHIFSLMWGKGIKKKIKYTDRVYNIDFTKTMTAILGVKPPQNATGRVLDVIDN